MNSSVQQAHPPLKPAIFLHIQKTAGTTIVELAARSYGSSNVISHGDYVNGLIDFPLNEDKFFQVENMQNRFGNIPFISGHFGYDFAKNFMQNRYSFTFLRNPVERILSFYYFCKSRNGSDFEIYDLCQRLSLDEFLKLGFSDLKIKPFIWNCQVSQLAHGFGSTESFHITDKEMLKLAMQHLDEFSYVGFTESFEKDRDNILKDLGITAPKDNLIINAGPTRELFGDLPKSTQVLLLELTKLDRALYKKFWSRKNSLFKRYMKKWLEV